MADDVSDLTPTERSAMIMDLLRGGARMTEEEVAIKAGLRVDGARKMLRRISRVCAIYEDDGVWRIRIRR